MNLDATKSPSHDQIVRSTFGYYLPERFFALTGITFSFGKERTDRLLQNGVTRQVKQLG